MNAATWAAIAVVTTLLRVVFYDKLETSFFLMLVLEPAGFTYTWLLHLIYRRFVGLPHRVVLVGVLACVLSLLGGFGQSFLADTVRDITDGPIRDGYGTPFMAAFFYVPVFLAWSIAYFWIGARSAARSESLRRSQAETTALRSELRFLQSQLDPHFLFNALNTIAAEIPDRPDTALEMTHAVASYLRIGLECDGNEVCRLRTELEHVKDFLRIQELRFEDHLSCQIDVTESACETLVPCFILQGFVENAIKHGSRDENGLLVVQVQADREGDVLAIEVTNRGSLYPLDKLGTGVGIENTRRRLEIAYAGRHDLEIRQQGPEVLVRLRLEGAPCFV
ncbi:sensor histidine kinase [Tropicimonas isoalkanivorans]|uniref:sensor histidine kinase n=1 Tax=Tropicimonas isoalkanivorans TaxID=441112 RepID=UPI0015A5BEA7|nr:histidine kinase [Tropicimonas isoalkanivorans]